MKIYPKVSIGLPTYNRAKGLAQAIHSVWEQKYPNLELIISDNCSTDETELTAGGIASGHPEIIYHRQKKNIGMVANFEFVLREATGKYFMWISDDDELEPDVLCKYVSFLEENPGYSLASGEIKYCMDNKRDMYERGFTFEQRSSSLRVMHYYAKVVYGGMIHGLMRREMAEKIGLRNVIGNDFHFIANLAFLGAIKHFSFVGYRKRLGGTSKDFFQYAHHLGDSLFAARFPHLKMACDAFLEVMHRSSVYEQMPMQAKFALASSAFCGMILRYYGGIFPFIVGGRIVRLVKRPVVDSFKMQRADNMPMRDEKFKVTSLSQLEKLEKKPMKPLTTEVTKSA